jgi:hypothetical protein
MQCNLESPSHTVEEANIRIRILLEHNWRTLCNGKDAWASEASLLTDQIYHLEQRKEIDLLTSFCGRRLKMNKVSFFTYAVESYDGPFWRSLFSCNLFSVVHELSVAASSSAKDPDRALSSKSRNSGCEIQPGESAPSGILPE